MRLFVAVNLPVEVKEHLHSLQQQLYSVTRDVKWVEPSNFHLTIKFLGETEPKQLSAIKEALERSVVGGQLFKLGLNKLGTFPQRGIPKVVWVGLAGNVDALQKLQQQVEGALADVGFEPEKRCFSPHLTLGRIKSTQAQNQLLAAITNLNNQQSFQQQFAINSIELMQSVLKREGPVYSELASYSLSSRY